MFPMDGRVIREQPVTVEYDCRGKRVRKTCANSIEARRFYREKFMAGKNPTVVAKCGSTTQQ